MSTKRSIAASVKLSEQDWKLLQEAAAQLWPGLQLTRSTLILTLARRAAEEALKNKPPRKH